MDVFGALADPTRRALLRRLAGGPVRVVDLTAEHAMSRPAISRHLRILGDAGLVTATEQGRERHYRLTPEPLSEVQALVQELTAASATRRPPVTAQHLDALATEVRRTGRDRRRAAADAANETTDTTATAASPETATRPTKEQIA